MTIGELGSIGELVAAVATVVTLAYLALQIRGSTVATKAEARRAVRSDSSHTFGLIAADPDLARILMAGLVDLNSLEPIDAIRFRFLMAEFVSHIEATWKEWQSGAGDEEEVRDIVGKSKAMLASPGGREWWGQNSQLYKPAFRDYIDSRLN